MDRREFLRAAAAAISLGCSCQVGAVGWPKSDEKAGNANRSEGGWPGAGQSSPKKNGGGDTFSFDRACALSHAEAQSFRDSVRLLQSTGWPFIDQLFALETRVLGDVTSLRPGFAFFDDSAGPNAFATNATFLGSNHGSVCFGVQLLKMEQEEQSFAWEGA